MTIRTIKLPVKAPSWVWERLAWPSKDPADVLPYSIDCTDWLDDAELVLEKIATVRKSDGIRIAPSFVLGPVGANAPTLITIQISGGQPGAIERAAFELVLSGGNSLSFEVALPIRFPTEGLTPVSAGNVLKASAALIIVM